MSPSAKEVLFLKSFVEKIHPLPENEWDEFSRIWETVTVKRKVILRSPGETEKNLYFVLEGVQRAFQVDEKGNEHTIVFTYPHSFSGVADSFLTQTPTTYFFETLTASILLKTTHVQLFSLMEKSRAMERLILKTTAFALKGVIARQIELSSFSAEKSLQHCSTGARIFYKLFHINTWHLTWE